MGDTYILAAYWEGLYNKACMEIFDIKEERSKERNDAIALMKVAHEYQVMVKEKLSRLEDKLKQADFRLLCVDLLLAMLDYKDEVQASAAWEESLQIRKFQQMIHDSFLPGYNTIEYEGEANAAGLRG